MYNLSISEEDINLYLDRSINRIFAILAIFEECEDCNNMSTFYSYLDRLIIEFNGIKDIFDITLFMSIVGILNGMKNKDRLTHKEVKSLVFHCISIVKKGFDRDEIL